MFERDQFEREVVLRLADGSEGFKYRYRSQADFRRPGIQRFNARYVLPLVGARGEEDEPDAEEGLTPKDAFRFWVERASATAERRAVGPHLLSVIAKAQAATVVRALPPRIRHKAKAWSTSRIEHR